MLRCAPSTTQRATIRPVVGISDADLYAGFVTTGLWQRHADRSAGLSTTSPPVCAQRCGSGLQGTAPRYLSDDLRRVADVTYRGRLRSSSTDELLVRRARLTTIGDRTVAVAGSRLWYSLC